MLMSCHHFLAQKHYSPGSTFGQALLAKTARALAAAHKHAARNDRLSRYIRQLSNVEIGQLPDASMNLLC